MSDTSTSSNSNNACPVKNHSAVCSFSRIRKNEYSTNDNFNNDSDAIRCPHQKDFSKNSKEGCSSNSIINSSNNMPFVSNKPLLNVGQHISLDTTRQISSIPRSFPEKTEKKDNNNGTVNMDRDEKFWIYPSEQMFFNAMKRKNWDPHEGDMRVVVPIHNAVNEKAWKEILKWEELHEK